MSSHASPHIEIDLTARRSHRALAVFGCGCAITALLVLFCGSDAAAPAKVMGVLLALIAVTGFVHRGWLGPVRSVTRATWQSTGDWLLHTADGRQYRAHLASGTRLLPNFMILRWRHDAGFCVSYAFDRDLQCTVARRLRTRLRMEGITLPVVHEPAP